MKNNATKSNAPKEPRDSPSLIHSILLILGIVVFRFRAVPRIWALHLVTVNAASVLFLSHVEGWVTCTLIPVFLSYMGRIYQREGFVRLLGTGHAPWIPMLVWITASRLSAAKEEEDAIFYHWLLLLIATNSVALILDGIDLYRYRNGETDPHYTWSTPSLKKGE